MIKMGVIGYGYWGPNIVRNFNSVDGVSVDIVCDKNPKATSAVGKIYPNITVTPHSKDITDSPEVLKLHSSSCAICLLDMFLVSLSNQTLSLSGCTSHGKIVG